METSQTATRFGIKQLVLVHTRYSRKLHYYRLTLQIESETRIISNMERWNLQRLTLAFLILLPLISAAPKAIPPGQAKKLLDAAKPPAQESPPAPNPQQTEVSLVCASSIVDLVFVVDGSSSVCQNDTFYGTGKDAKCNNWNYMLQFIYDFVADFTISQSFTRVGLITFANEGRVEWKLQKHQTKQALQDAILGLRYPGGARNTADGIRLLRTKIFDQNSRDKRQAPRAKAAIFVTDGVPTQTEKFPSEIKAAHDAGITTFAVGVSNRVNEPVLKMLCSPPQQSNSDYYSIQTYSQIMSILTLLKRRTCTLFFNPVPPTLPPVTTKVKTTKAAKTQAPQTNPADCVTYPMDLVFMVDGSGSICESDPKYKSNKDKTCGNYDYILKFLTKFVKDLDISPTGTRVGLVTFASDSVLRWTLGKYTKRSDLEKAIRDLPYPGGNTDTAGGLRTVLTQAFGGPEDRSYAPNTLVIITDGKPSDTSSAVAEAARIQAAGIKTYVLGVTSNVDELTLQQLCSAPHRKNQNYYTATDFKNIELILKSLQWSTICRDNTISVPIFTTYPPTRPTTRLTSQPVVVASSTPSEIRVCGDDNKQDIVFVLDASGSICDSDPDYDRDRDTTCNNFKFILDFVANTVQDLDIGPDQTRVGVVTFSADAEVIFDLSQYTTKDELINAILNIPYVGSQTQTARGLEVARTQVFGTSGDRPDAPNTAVIITDGQPTDAAAVPGAVQRVHDQGITTYAIGVTNEVNEQTLQELSSAPHQKDENYFIASDFSSIDYIRDKFHNAAICTSNTALQNNDLETSFSTSTVAITVKDCGSDHRQDIVFVIDRSGSICDTDANYVYLRDTNCNNFRSVLEFVANIVQSLDIGPDKTRVGLVAFSSDASVAWDLSTYTTKDELVNAIRNLPYDGGETFQDKGLDLMRTRVFGAYGDRPDVNNTAIILTDGMPSDPAAVPPAIQLVHDQGITTYAIGVTNQINEDNLKLLSSAPGQKDQNYFVASDFNTMEYIRNKVQSAATCQ